MAPTPSDIPPTPDGGGGADGQEIVQQNGCRACHSIDGSAGIGPTWQGLFGKEESLNDGSTVQVDDVYLEESIVDPNAKIVEGFAESIMPQGYGQSLSNEEIGAVVEYIKTFQ